MSATNNRRRDPGGTSAEQLALLVAVLLVIAAVAAVDVTAVVGHRIAGTGGQLPTDPFDLFFGLIGGDVPWPPAGTWLLVTTAAVLTALTVLLAVSVLRARRRRTRVDAASAFMGRGRDVAALGRKHATETAARLGVADAPGVPIGRTVATGKWLYGTWEDMHIDIWGPRTGKTTSRAVPAILTAPGAVLVTSNKRDVVDATRDVRAAQGPVWVFDPQAIALEEPTWWWNPLSYVTDEVKAARLAEHFAAGSRAPGARTDAYFDPAGQDLLAGMLLAAALDSRPITDVYRWLTRPDVDDAVQILTDHDYPLTADQVTGVIAAPDKQRGGIYGTAQQMASCLTNRQVAAWVTPRGAVDTRRQFDPAAFVATGGTLYSLSKEGKGTAGPLVTALTVAVVEAAEELAARSAGGRLSTPLLGVLDEAANVCRWRDLPNLYSHYGSRGIVLMTILQSWSQGTEVWGDAGMRKLWSAANVKVYGGGVSEAAFLEDLSRMVGDHDRQASSVSTGKGHRTVSRQLHRERILDVAELAALPRGRAVVLASGSRPTLIATQPWMTGPHADAVQASIAAHDLQSATTLLDEWEVGTPAPTPTVGRDQGEAAVTAEALGEWSDLEDDVADFEPEPDAALESVEPEPTLYYGSLDDFVREIVVDLYRRRVGPRAEFRWAAQWWRSTEAMVRLEAMWRSWENLRRDPALGMSAWLLQHGDPQMRALLDPVGPFAGSEDTNRIGEPLPYETPPAGLFPDARLSPAIAPN